MENEITRNPETSLAQIEKDPQLWAQAVADGHLLAASRLMRYLDDRVPMAIAVIKYLFHRTGRAHIIGITGSPGTGKSTLVDQVVAEARKRDKTVGVVAVDPSSPFTEGAILGDRIRMKRHNVDPGVFIRSLATRGQLGGLSRSTYDIVDVMDAMGKEVIIVETVGVGQDEMDIIKLAQTNIVLQVPGLGDDIQAIKAGILEAGDIFVVNKVDLEGADRAVKDLEMMIQFNEQSSCDHTPPVIKTQANIGIGIDQLMDCIERHSRFIRSGNGADLEKRRRRTRFLEILRQSLFERIYEHSHETKMARNLMEKVENRLIDPYSAAEELLSENLRSST